MTSLLEKHAKSFYWASFFLSKEIFYKCSSLYNFCRTLDDIVDNESVIKTKKENFLKFKKYLEMKDNDQITNNIKEEIKLMLYNNRELCKDYFVHIKK